ncbi:MAG: TerC family protein [Alphaproteobacteria bacterium]
MLEWLMSPHVWAALATLTLLEIVLGIDNVIFLSIITGRLPHDRQRQARRLGLGLALLFRLAALAGLTWLIGLTTPVFTWDAHAVSWRDIILFAGGLFLLWKGTEEIHHETEGADPRRTAVKAGFAAVVAQIVVIDVVFSLDSILTAIGLSRDLAVMVVAVCIAILIMLLAAEPVSAFVNRHPSVKMLALAFLLLIGVALLADALHFEIPRGYLYFAVAFSAGVETLNLWAAARRRRRAAAQTDAPRET